jgi:hypothetical protein
LGFRLENERYPIVMINLYAPNFNFGLLPDFDIGQNKYALLPPENAVFSQLPNLLIEQELTYENAVPDFMAATINYAYMDFIGSSAFLGVNSSAGRRFYPVADWQEAEEILRGIEGAPLYILNQR